jgi:hypothetical protein
MEVKYYHAYIDGVDFVFIDNPIFHHVESEVYGGNRRVSNELSLVMAISFMNFDTKAGLRSLLIAYNILSFLRVYYINTK